MFSGIFEFEVISMKVLTLFILIINHIPSFQKLLSSLKQSSNLTDVTILYFIILIQIPHQVIFTKLFNDICKFTKNIKINPIEIFKIKRHEIYVKPGPFMRMVDMLTERQAHSRLGRCIDQLYFFS